MTILQRNTRFSRRARRNRRQRESRWLVMLLVAALIGAVALAVYDAVRPRPGIAMPDLGNLHITYPETAEYNSYPPTSGPHYVQLAPWGIHDTPIPNELQVHNLEDGGVMVQYDCPEGCPELVEQLAEIVQRYDRFVILAPYPNMETRIALTAWTRIDRLDEFDADRIVRFIEAYRGIDHHK